MAMDRPPQALRKLFGIKGAELFMRGVELFNQGEHWEAHEVFEEVWRGGTGDAKTLAQAFVQAAAAFSYIRRKKYESILYLFDKSVEKLQSTGHLLPEGNIDELRSAIVRTKGEIQRLGKQGLDRFDPETYPTIRLLGQGPKRRIAGKRGRTPRSEGKWRRA